ncbi:MAG: Rho termination factor N-terminal domain-containing protein [Clostridia bacterium]|nr:Rho termination factor N-terminal domain-containing protein [Clostridia bacterium]
MKVNFDNLQNYTMGELRMIAKMFRIKSPTAMKKSKLIEEIIKAREGDQNVKTNDVITSQLATDLLGDVDVISSLHLSDKMDDIKGILTDCIVCVLSLGVDGQAKKQILDYLLKALDKANNGKQDNAYIKSVKNFVDTL